MMLSPSLYPGARRRLAAIDRRLARAYRTPLAALGNKADPLDEAIYIVLSFQTDVPRAMAIWTRLRRHFRSWGEVERARLPEIAAVLREGGLHRQKARTIRSLLRNVRELDSSLSLNFLGSLEDNDAERILTRLPGLSWKGARCVLLYSLGRDVFPVDSNTFRILKRVGVIRPAAVYRRRELHDALQGSVPPKRRRSLHVNLVLHGQRTCVPLRPRCHQCALRKMCPRVGVTELDDVAPIPVRRSRAPREQKALG
jgi:endonuclease III